MVLIGYLAVMFRALIIFLFLTVPTSADTFIDGNYLYNHCEKDHRTSQAFCSGYILGAIDSMEGIARVNNTIKSPFCFDANVMSDQLIDVVKAYPLDNPDERHHTAHSLVDAALAPVFECD